MNPSKLTRVRSWLFTPATRPDRFDKAAASGADVSIIDLENPVVPADEGPCREIKDAVRSLENIHVRDLMKLLGQVKAGWRRDPLTERQ